MVPTTPARHTLAKYKAAVHRASSAVLLSGFQSYCSSKFFLCSRIVQLWNTLPEKVLSASSVSAFISRLNSTHVSSFLTFCFSAVCFFIWVYFRARVSAFRAFLSSRHSSALYCFYGIVSVCLSVFVNCCTSVGTYYTTTYTHTRLTALCPGLPG